eukprot:11191057-Lingulodinium_polyedra.AAC.1
MKLFAWECGPRDLGDQLQRLLQLPGGVSLLAELPQLGADRVFWLIPSSQLCQVLLQVSSAQSPGQLACRLQDSSPDKVEADLPPSDAGTSEL